MANTSKTARQYVASESNAIQMQHAQLDAAFNEHVDSVAEAYRLRRDAHHRLKERHDHVYAMASRCNVTSDLVPLRPIEEVGMFLFDGFIIEFVLAPIPKPSWQKQQQPSLGAEMSQTTTTEQHRTHSTVNSIPHPAARLPPSSPTSVTEGSRTEDGATEIASIQPCGPPTPPSGPGPVSLDAEEPHPSPASTLPNRSSSVFALVQPHCLDCVSLRRIPKTRRSDVSVADVVKHCAWVSHFHCQTDIRFWVVICLTPGCTNPYFNFDFTTAHGRLLVKEHMTRHGRKYPRCDETGISQLLYNLGRYVQSDREGRPTLDWAEKHNQSLFATRSERPTPISMNGPSPDPMAEESVCPPPRRRPSPDPLTEESVCPPPPKRPRHQPAPVSSHRRVHTRSLSHDPGSPQTLWPGLPMR
ncbi:hypothetical protein V8F33_013716 [Rhypophila sp. PSN 637]